MEGWAVSGSHSRSSGGGGDTADSLRDAPLRKSQQCTMTSHKGMATAQNIPAEAAALASKPHETQRKEKACHRSRESSWRPSLIQPTPVSLPAALFVLQIGGGGEESLSQEDYMSQCAILPSAEFVFVNEYSVCFRFKGNRLYAGSCGS